MFIPLELRKRINKNIRRKILRDFKTKERSYFAVFYNKNTVSIDLVDYENITEKILEEPINYETSITALKKIIEKDIF